MPISGLLRWGDRPYFSIATLLKRGDRLPTAVLLKRGDRLPTAVLLKRGDRAVQSFNKLWARFRN